MRCFALLVVCLLFIELSAHIYAQNAIRGGSNAVVKGVPGVPIDLARQVDRYGEYRTASFAVWHPERLEMLVLTRFANTSQVHHVTKPGGQRRQLTFFKEPVLSVSSWAKKKDKEFFTYLIDVGGDEFYQVFSFDPATRTSTLLTDGKKRNSGGIYSDESGLLVYSRVDADANGALTEIRTVDPQEASSDRLVMTFRGGGWSPTDWSPDGKRVLVLEYRSINDSRLWEVDVTTGKSKQLSPTKIDTKPIAHGRGVYLGDGEAVVYGADADGEFRQLMRSKSGKRHLLTADKWDVEAVDISPNGKYIAYAKNEGGRSVLNVIDATTSEPVVMPPIPVGVIRGLRWHNDSQHLAFSLSSAAIPGDVFVAKVRGELTRWTYSESAIDTSSFPEPELVEWKSFDGLKVTGFLYRPPARFKGKRPVIMNIHGGPESQTRPRYLGRLNYFLNELGIAIVFPNVRGSRGYGKSFLKLDNGLLREGTHKDISALIDWIESRDDLDQSRIMVRGGSYGGYMTLSAAYRFSDRIACAVDLVGISNLRTFLENTQGYRRDLRRAEYGDERNAELRKWMDDSSALENVDKIRKPLLVLQGANDPRVPKSESDQIVAALEKTGTPVWYVVFNDEGHGFRKKSNADYAFYSTVLFARKFLSMAE